MLHVDHFADSHLHAYAPFEHGLHTYDVLASLGITDANLLAYTYIETGIDNNLVCLYYKEKCQSIRLRTFGGLYYDPKLNNKIMPYKEQAELLLAMGCDGIKFLDMKPNYNLYCGCSMDDPVYDALYDMLEEKAVPLVTHIADPANFWYRDQIEPEHLARGWCYEDPRFLRMQEIFDITVRRLERNPRLRMSLAHLGFMSLEPELLCSILDRFPNVTVDLAPATNLFIDFGKNISLWRALFTEYSSRILYGTDTSTGCSDQRIIGLNRTMIEAVSHDCSELPVPHDPRAIMRGLDLDAEAQKNICFRNYDRFAGSDIKPLDRHLFTEHAALIRSIAEQDGNTSMTANIDYMLKTL